MVHFNAQHHCLIRIKTQSSTFVNSASLYLASLQYEIGSLQSPSDVHTIKSKAVHWLKDTCSKEHCYEGCTIRQLWRS
jgi:hypothetical protein